MEYRVTYTNSKTGKHKVYHVPANSVGAAIDYCKKYKLSDKWQVGEVIPIQAKVS